MDIETLIKGFTSPVFPQYGALHAFADPRKFYSRHFVETVNEFLVQQKAIEEFNKKKYQFNAWVIKAPTKRSLSKSFIFRLSLRPPKGSSNMDMVQDFRAPEPGQSFKLGLVRTRKKSDFFSCSTGPETISLNERWGDTIELTVEIPTHYYDDHFKDCQCLVPLLLGEKSPKDLHPRRENSIQVRLKLVASRTTMMAELGALERFKRGNFLSKASIEAFKYMIDFKEPDSHVNLHTLFPHFGNPESIPDQGVRQRLIKLMDRFDNDQMAAYHGLSSIPAGVAFIPGGPGAGKTWWTLMMAVLAQAGRKHTRMLYLLDINKTVDDAAGKIQAIYNNLGLQRSVVRLYKSQWPKGHLADEENYDEEVYDENGFRISNADSKWTSIKSVDWTSNFLRQRDQIHHRELSLAATLDQMAWGRYKSSGLYPAIELALARMSDATQTDEHGADMKILRSELIQLYADTLDNIDFLATTPVAGRALSGMYQPDLVIFDECAHARELSTLIALAHFTPKAWFLVGDHRQDEPFVQSLAQPPVHLRISTMERAAINNAISHQLLVNHRAYGGLERLASSLFYDGKMRSGKTRDNLFPTSLQHLRKWLDEMAGVYPMYGDLTTPRLIVSETDNVRARKAGTSFWKPRHHEFVMDKV